MDLSLVSSSMSAKWTRCSFVTRRSSRAAASWLETRLRRRSVRNFTGPILTGDQWAPEKLKERSMSTPMDEWRIADGWFDIAGRWNPVSEDVRRLLRNTIDEKMRQEDQQPAPPVWFVRAGEHHDLQGACDLVLEDGTQVDRRSMGGGTVLPPDLPIGAHRLEPLDGGLTTQLFVVPRAQDLLPRSWGWAVQLYATRSRASWGHGDLGDLASLAEWATAHGATLLSHNPLGDPLPIASQEPSPYFTSSRKFRSLLYLRIESVPGASEIGGNIARLAASARSLNGERLIDRDEIYRLKLSALREIWTATSKKKATRSVIERSTSDQELVDHATFNALAQRFGSGWHCWDRVYSHPRSRSVARFREANRDEVEFWIWVQALLADQHRVAANSGTGLLNDLPVGFTVDGSDAWVDQDCLALDWRIGAPGDEFNPDGQNWGIVPYLPQKLRAVGYEPWIRTLRRLMVNTGALRVDHVMGLFRLFVIPAGTEYNDGAYLYQFGTELLDIALMEAVRAGVTLTGEDLGTVEDEVREALDARNILRYKVAWFEDLPPAEWPEASVGSISTHDLPTIAGLVSGTDAELRLEAGIPVDPADDLRMLARLNSSLGGDGTDGPARPVEEVIVAAHRLLASAGSRTVLCSLEDACAVTERPNLPGTIDEHPNWRLALPVAIEDLDSTLATPISDAMRRRAVLPPNTESEDRAGLDRLDCT